MTFADVKFIRAEILRKLVLPGLIKLSHELECLFLSSMTRWPHSAADFPSGKLNWESSLRMGSVFAAEARLAVAKREARRRALMFIIVASVGYGNGMRGL